jgi:hypothetical protein
MMQKITTEHIPMGLRYRKQWVMWKAEVRGDRSTKVPYQPTGQLAKSNDLTTWCEFAIAEQTYANGGWDGIGFVFSADDGFCGIDLDGCRNPKTGVVAQWAKEVILTLDTYAEVSPTGTGVKLFIVGRNPMATGKKRLLTNEQAMGDKSPAVEMYDSVRFFAMTGWRLRGQAEPQARQEWIDWFAQRYWPDDPKPAPLMPPLDFRSESAVVERARRYVAKLPPAISGQRGHDATFHAACVLVMGFGLDESASLALLAEYSQRCSPPWSERELRHKVSQAAKQPGDRNYLRNAKPERWESIRVPSYPSPPPVPEMQITTLAAAARKYIDRMKSGGDTLIELGLNEVDQAIGGGVEPGEMVVLAARPSHGKSAVALQCVHTWTRRERKVLVISEEMSSLMLGKRTLQFASEMVRSEWEASLEQLEQELAWYMQGRTDCYIAESCGTSEAAAERIEWAVRHGVQCVVVDYAQLLRSPGKSRYEQVTNTSVMLRQLASKHKIVLVVLAQLSREIESRQTFTPQNSDLKDSGQIEQDADVILHLVWPYKIDQRKDKNEFLFYVGKNRNREISRYTIAAKFIPHRQMFLPPPVKRDTTIDAFNNQEFPA